MTDFLRRIKDLPPQKLALLAAQLQERLEQSEARLTAERAIAVIGVGCRFPGGADDPESYWDLLEAGRDAIGEIPGDRWDADALYDPDWQAEGRMATRWGAFLDGIDRFDARLFGISPREAVSMDPQQRLLLEVTWQALERAAIAPHRLEGSATGVFVGLSSTDYLQLQMRRGLGPIDGYLASGSAPSVAAGRLAYVLGLHGPALTVDTACSSSLVAIHLAVRALRDGQCDVAIGAGVNVILSPVTSVALSKAQMMAPDGRCKAFSARADGFVRGEGCGVLVLKRLADAHRDGDPIVGVIRGSAINQDGRSNGLTAPNGPAQESVLAAALADAGLAPADIGYVEAHGTGTRLGDPIEVQALGAVLGQGRTAERRLQIGSVKTNIGHLESAAGVAGLIKALMVVEQGTIPPHLHLDEPSAVIPWDALAIDVPTATTPWPAGRPRCAGVSSFGFSGTNAHVIVEAPPAPVHQPAGDRSVHVLALSAQSEAALDELARRHGAHLTAHDVPLAELCATLNAGRDGFAHRHAFVAETVGALRDQLDARGRGETPRRSMRDHLDSTRPVRPVWLFTGQGAQYGGMGRVLHTREPVFAEVLDRCDAFLRERFDMPLLEVMFAPDDPRLHQTAFTQPALFALEVALAALWRSWGVQPAAVMGHSVGELAAAHVAGLFDLEDGLSLIANRARLMQAIPAGGRMVAMACPPERIEAALREHEAFVALAAVNGPDSVVISGEGTRVQAVIDALGGTVATRDLEVSHAFHSPAMAPMVEAIGVEASRVSFRDPEIPIISNVLGARAGRAEMGDPAYWQRHVLAPVRFGPALAGLVTQGHRVFLELGPQPTLAGMGARANPQPELRWVHTLRQDRSDDVEAATAVARLWTSGVAVDWRAWEGSPAARRRILPTYPMQRERFWLDGVGPWEDAGRAADRGPTDDLLYDVSWVRRDRPAATEPGRLGITAPQHWLLVGDGPLSDAVARELAGAGDTIARPNVADRAGVLEAVIAQPPHGLLVVCDPPAAADAAQSEAWQRERHRSLTGALLASVHALLDAVTATPLWIVTAGAVGPEDSAVRDPGAATAWGLGHVVELEHPELGCRRVDLGDGPVDAAARRLVRELGHPNADEPQVAWRGDGRYLPRLTPGHLPPQATVELDPDASYLVSGGLRGVGLLVSDWMVRRGARHLVLFGRQEPGPDAVAAIERWSLQGATVVVEPADASVDEDIRRVIERARQLAPLRGVIHCAGVLADASLLRQDWTRFEAVYGPKVFGTAALTSHLPLHELDFLVLFASAAGVAGWPGQANYSAANAFLDATAHELRADGVPVVSIDWGPWQDVGMAVSRGIDRSPAAFSVEQGLAVLEQVIGAVAARSAPAQLLVRSSDWSDVLERYPAGAEPSLLRDLLRDRRDGAPGAVEADVQPEPGVLTAALAGLPERRQRMVVRDEVRRLAALVLDVDDAERIELGEPLHDLGMDSLMAVELRNRIGVALGEELPATLLFEHPSVTALVEHLFDTVLAPAVAPARPTSAVNHRNGAEAGPSPARDADLGGTAGMDADELALALAARLDRLGGRS